MNIERAREILAEYSFIPDSRLVVSRPFHDKGFHLRLESVMSDSAEPERKIVVNQETIAHGETEEVFRAEIEQLCRAYWWHEFNEWFRRGGKCVIPPH